MIANVGRQYDLIRLLDEYSAGGLGGDEADDHSAPRAASASVPAKFRLATQPRQTR